MRALGPTRRTIPTGYMVCVLRLTGETPLLMSSGEVDRESDTYKAYRELSRTRRRSDDQEARLRELEWYTRLHWEEKIGCYIPGKNVKELLRSAATKWRMGEEVKRSLVVPDYRIPLIYDGPSKPDELWAAGFHYTAMVSNAGPGSGRVERTRPCFEEWSLECDIAFDIEDLSFDDVASYVGRSQKYGLGDGRGIGFGAFTATLERKRTERPNARANGGKRRDKHAERAVRSHAKRVTTSV